jgi:hypothetical protein
MAINDACLCGTGMNNTGLVTCIKGFKKTTGMLIVPILANDGTRNSIDLSTAIDMDAKVKHLDPSKRFYPVNDLKDVELPTAESRFETAKDGSKFKLADGIKSFKATIYEAGSMFASKLQGVSCEKYGVYLYDIDGNLRGIKDGNLLYPVEIGGWDAIFMDSTDDNVSKIQVQFDFDILLKISRYWILSSTDLGVNPNTLLGLVDANLTEVSSGATSTVLTISSDYGSGLTALPIVGLVTADFSAYNDTDASAVTLTVAESTTVDGEYTLTYTSQTVADKVTIKVLPASGYEGSVQVTI